MVDFSPTSPSSRVLVVGGAGYVGSVLTAQLLASGSAVRVLDDFVWENAGSLVHLADDPCLEVMAADMRDASSTADAMTSVDAVVVLAGLVGDPITKTYPEESRSINIDGVTTVVDAALEAGVPRLVFASTCSNYGLHAGDQLADEESPLSPLSLYAEQKVAIEHTLLGRAGHVGTSVTIMRFATAFGLSSRMRLDLTVSHFAKDAVRDRRIEIYDADTWRPYCHVADLSEAVRLVLNSDDTRVRGEVFNVGSTSENYTKRRLGELVASLRPDVELVFRDGGLDARNYRVSFEKIERRLGFRASRSVADHMPRLLRALETGIVSMDSESVATMGNYRLPDRLLMTG